MYDMNSCYYIDEMNSNILQFSLVKTLYSLTPLLPNPYITCVDYKLLAMKSTLPRSKYL